MAELDADHRRMLADRERHKAHDSVPVQLARRYAPHVDQPTRVDYYFGTDIPIEDVDWEESVAEHNKQAESEGGGVVAWICLSLMALALVAYAWLVLA